MAPKVSAAAKQIENFKAQLQEVDLSQPLSGEEDEDLVEDMLRIADYLNITYVKPPNTRSLKEWGTQLFPQGKHKAATFSDIFDTDLQYSLLMSRKTTLTSAWAKSFQNYVLARLKAVAQAAEVERNLGKPQKGESMFNPKTRVAQAMGEDEWKLCALPETPPSSRKTAGPAKREGETSTSSRMKVDVDKVEIQTRRALLLRELAALDEAEDDN